MRLKEDKLEKLVGGYVEKHLVICPGENLLLLGTKKSKSYNYFLMLCRNFEQYILEIAREHDQPYSYKHLNTVLIKKDLVSLAKEKIEAVKAGEKNV